MGDHFNLEISTSYGKTYTFFVKSMPTLLPNFESYINEIGTFTKETKLFQTLLEKLRKLSTNAWCPKSYYIYENDAIIMENLVRKGYQVMNHREYFTYQQFSAFIKTVAAFHSTTIIYEELTRKNSDFKNFRLIDKYRNLLEECGYPCDETHIRHKALVCNANAFVSNLKYLNNYKEGFDKQIWKELNNLPNRMKINRYRNVMNHGDLWCNNIMFSGNEGENLKCLLVDFQFARYACPSQDLMLAMYTTTNREFRTKYYDHFLEMYYNALGDELKTYSLNINELYPKNDFLQSCSEKRIVGILLAALYTVMVFYRSEDIDNVLSNADNFWPFNFGNKNEFVLNILKNDEHLRERFSEIYQDILEYVL
ncbi:uncharacterized protein LOC123291003 [Chrysoperla carnea]|uniref:uncharacterized protein LOC123291003 n=1 Tax=Chrysoperla carnea TaxID=189513 RepID=UPI001D065B1F|nr:uncharacterized protein LOC123291003 [Chrysoperla carnea]